jgi:hypothetical protein
MKKTMLMSGIVIAGLLLVSAEPVNTALAVGIGGGGPPATGQITNPLGATSTLTLFIQKIIQFLLELVGLLALLAVVWGGVQYIISFGDDKKIGHAKQIIFWAVAGLIIVLLSYAIISTITGFLGIK